MDVPNPKLHRHRESRRSRSSLRVGLLTTIIVWAISIPDAQSQARGLEAKQPYVLALESNDIQLGEVVAGHISARLLERGESVQDLPPTSVAIESARTNEMEETLTGARRAYEQLEPTMAIERLEAWFAHLDGVDAPSVSREALAQALLLTALSHLALRVDADVARDQAVSRALLELQRVAPKFEPSPVEHPPPLHEAFAAARAAAPASHECALQIDAPSDLSLSIALDGTTVTDTDAVPCGPHTVRVKAPGYRSQGYRVVLTLEGASLVYTPRTSEGDVLRRGLDSEQPDVEARLRASLLVSTLGARALTLRIAHREDRIDASLLGLEGVGPISVSTATSTSAIELAELIMSSVERRLRDTNARSAVSVAAAKDEGPNWWLWSAAGAGVLVVAVATVAIALSAPSTESGFRIAWERP